MSLERLFLIAAGLFSVVVGFAYLICPADMAAMIGMFLLAPAAVIDVQAFYGGQMVGLGAFLLIAAFKPQLVLPALLMTALWLGGTALGRAAGMVANMAAPEIMIVLLVLETVTTAIAVALALRVKKLAA